MKVQKCWKWTYNVLVGERGDGVNKMKVQKCWKWTCNIFVGQQNKSPEVLDMDLQYFWGEGCHHFASKKALQQCKFHYAEHRAFVCRLAINGKEPLPTYL